MTARAIGVFGGTFDPVHFGHLRPALELYEQLGLAEVRLVPCRVPPHRDEPVASPAQRLAMLRMAVADHGELALDERELQRDGPSYMVDTLASLRREVGTQPLCLLVGSDAFLGLHRWDRWTQLVELAHIVVAHRSGWSLRIVDEVAELKQLVERHRLTDSDQLHQCPAGGIWFQPVSQLEISATAIRALVADGRSAAYLLPAAVEAYIRNHGLYCNDEE